MGKVRKDHIRKDPEKARQRKVLIFSIVMIALMVFSVTEVIIYNGSSSKEQTKYGEYEFSITPVQGGNVWTTTIGGQQVEFQTLPTHVAYIDVDYSAIQLLQNASQIVLSAPPNMTQDNAAMVDYSRLELGLALQKTANAISSPDEGSLLPVINCSQATAKMPVVLFNITNDTSVKRDGYCVIFNGEQSEILKVKDRVIFEYTGMLTNGTVAE